MHTWANIIYIIYWYTIYIIDAKKNATMTALSQTNIFKAKSKWANHLKYPRNDLTENINARRMKWLSTRFVVLGNWYYRWLDCNDYFKLEKKTKLKFFWDIKYLKASIGCLYFYFIHLGLFFFHLIYWFLYYLFKRIQIYLIYTQNNIKRQ